MGWLKKITKPFKKVNDFMRKGSAGIARVLGGAVGMSGLGNAVGDFVDTGDSAEANARKRADFEYARSLADQRAFQDDSVQRRVADARKAGIHPLAALGYQSPSFIPPQVNGYSTGESEYGLSEMGQDIGRAVQAARTKGERAADPAVSAYDAAILQRTNLENESLSLDLQYKRLRYLRMLRDGSKPGFAPNNSTSAGGQAVPSHLPDYMAIQQIGAAELSPSDQWSIATDRSGYSYYVPPANQDNELAQAEAFFRNKILYHAAGPFRRTAKMFDALPEYLGKGYKPKVYGNYPSRIPRRVRGSRPNPAYYKDGWYN